MSETLSVVIITKDEESNIKECLESIKWVDEIIVVDDMSGDATVAICRKYTDKIFLRKMDGFGAQKQYGFDKASCDWILSLDADERLSPELEKCIKNILKTGSGYAGYKIRCKTFYLGAWIRYCGWYIPMTRLFKRGMGGSDMKYVHEKILVSGDMGEIKYPILHYSPYLSIEQHVKKMKIYSDHDARLLYDRGARVTDTNAFWYCAIRPLIMFIRKYIVMGGILEGSRGFIISAFTGMVNFINYAKVWLIQMNTADQDAADRVDECLMLLDERSTLKSRNMMAAGIHITPFTIAGYFFFIPCGILLTKYIIKRGYRDGIAGLLIAVISAFTYFVSYTKLWSMQLAKR